MTRGTRRQYLVSSILLPTACCMFGRGNVTDSHVNSSRSASLPSLRWDGENTALIELNAELPSLATTQRLERLLLEAQSARRIIVRTAGRIAPTTGVDDRFAEWIMLCERYGVNEIIETSNRASEVTPPIRVGQVDPAGITYRINVA